MGSKNLRSSGSSASGLVGGLKAWLHRKKGAEVSTEECTEKTVHAHSRKNRYSVSRSPDFNWQITRYDKLSGYDEVRAEFEKRRGIEVEIPNGDIQIKAEPETAKIPIKSTVSASVPTLDEYFKEETIRYETKISEHPIERQEVKTYRQESLFEDRPKMVEAEEDDKVFEGLSYFTGVSSAVEVATCSSVSEMPAQMSTLESFNSFDKDITIYSEIESNEECSTVIEISAEDEYIRSVCDDIVTFTIMNEILPEILAEEEMAEEKAEEPVTADDPEDAFIADLCEDLVADFIVGELLPELLKERTAPEYVISDIGASEASETVIDIPEIVPEIAEEAKADDVTSFLFGFGNPVPQKKGTTGFRFVFGSCDDADYDDEEMISVSSNDAAITASSLSGSSISL